MSPALLSIPIPILFIDERPFTGESHFGGENHVREEFMADLDDPALSLTMAMGVDEIDPRDVFGKALLTPENNKLANFLRLLC